jgi:cytochrome c553
MRAALRVARVLCGLVAAGAAGSAPAQDSLAGKRLFHDAGRLRGTGISCVECHGGLPGGLHGIGKAAGNPAALDYAINAIPQMAPLRGKLSARDLEDLAAYIANPAVASPELRIGTDGPGSSAWSVERLEFPAPGAGAASPASTIRLSNAGALPLRLQSAPTLDGPHAAEFVITESDCDAGKSLDSAQSCSIRITFQPRGPAGLRSASVGVTHDWLGGRVRIALIGRVAPAVRRDSRPAIGTASR